MRPQIGKLLKEYCGERKYVLLTRKVGKVNKAERGYIISYSKDFVLFQASEDFKVSGYFVFNTNNIVSVKHDAYEKHYDKIMILRKEFQKIGITYEINLANWISVLKSIQSRKLAVVIELKEIESPPFLNMGSIKNIDQSAVYIQRFNEQGIIDEIVTPIYFKHITKITFDTKYINVFSKYSRSKKN